ncbi:MAG: CHASE3 domain-containing protein, partial [Actinomycetota bacterium]|nr:CHASE3 domain-containing protein [Actinomycetota bacterium]
MRAKGLIVVAIPVAAMLAAAPLVFAQIRSAEELNDSVRQTMQVDAQIQTVLVAVLSAETGIRGYISSGDDTFLVPYHQAATVLPGETSTLSALVRDEPEQKPRAAAIESLTGQELAALSYLKSLQAAPGDGDQSLQQSLLSLGQQ